MIRQFGQDEISVTFAGGILNCRSFKYEVKVDIKQNHVLGQKDAYDYVTSKETATGELVMPHSEYLRILNSLPPNTKPTDITDAVITTTYAQNEFAVNNVFEGIVITSFGEMLKNDSGAEDVTMQFIIGKIRLNSI